MAKIYKLFPLLLKFHTFPLVKVESRLTPISTHMELNIPPKGLAFCNCLVLLSLNRTARPSPNTFTTKNIHVQPSLVQITGKKLVLNSKCHNIPKLNIHDPTT